MSENRISDGSAAFLVYDKAIDGNDTFTKWLNDNGFSKWDKHGYYSGCSWVYINLNNRLYAPGMPGIAITSVLGNHAITISEFKTIYKIYEKYDGNDVFVFNTKKFDYD